MARVEVVSPREIIVKDSKIKLLCALTTTAYLEMPPVGFILLSGGGAQTMMKL